MPNNYVDELKMCADEFLKYRPAICNSVYPVKEGFSVYFTNARRRDGFFATIYSIADLCKILKGEKFKDFLRRI